MNNTTTDNNTDLEEYIRSNIIKIFHLTETSSMSPVRANWKVVNLDLRVKGVSRLRIVNISILVSAFLLNSLLSEIDSYFSFFLTFKLIVPAAYSQVPIYIVSKKSGDLIKRHGIPQFC